MRSKKKTIMALAASLLTLGCAISCGNNGNNNSQPSSSTKSQLNVEYDETYHSEAWDDDVLSVIGKITEKEKASMVPTVDADEYYFGITKETDDNGNSLDLVIIRCYGIFERTVEATYEKSLVNAGYQLSGELPYGFIEYSLTDDLIVQYELKQDADGETAFELMIYRYEYRIDYWPEETIREILGEKIPEIKADCYEIYPSITAKNEMRVSIYAYHMTEKDVTEYESSLKMAGYSIKVGSYFNEAISPSGYVTIMYEYYMGVLTANVTNAWPYLYITELLGKDLPKLSNDASNFEFGFIGDDEILTLYYDGVTLDDMTAYGAVLEREGYKFVEERKSTGSLTITTRDYSYGKDEHLLSLMYCLEQQTIAIAIYY